MFYLCSENKGAHQLRGNLISFAVTAKLICVFVFAYSKSRFSHDAAHFVLTITDSPGQQEEARVQVRVAMMADSLMKEMMISTARHMILVIDLPVELI